MAELEAAVARVIAAGAIPAGVRVLFEKLRNEARIAVRPGEGDLDRLIQRIQGLRAKTVDQGCTEQKALSAAEKVAELLDRYGLSLSEIEFRRQTCEGARVTTGRRRLGAIDDSVPAIAAFFDCRVWSEKDADGVIRHVFFGLRCDVEAAHYLYDLVEHAFATETTLFTTTDVYGELTGGDRRSATHSFQVGLARGIRAKLHTLRAERERTLRRSSGRDLIPLKASVVDDELARLGLEFRARSRAVKRFVMTEAYETGEEAGQRFAYRPGLNAA